jgi:hypothetical protein
MASRWALNLLGGQFDAAGVGDDENLGNLEAADGVHDLDGPAAQLGRASYWPGREGDSVSEPERSPRIVVTLTSHEGWRLWSQIYTAS